MATDMLKLADGLVNRSQHFTNTLAHLIRMFFASQTIVLKDAQVCFSDTLILKIPCHMFRGYFFYNGKICAEFFYFVSL